jgi:hypothetical protein
MSGQQTFDVPNDSEGREFLRLIKKFKAPGHSFRARSRGTRKLPGVPYVSFNRRMSIPQCEAESFAVYMGKLAHNKTFLHDLQLDYSEQSLLRKAKSGELIAPLTLGERIVLKEVVHEGIDGLKGAILEEEMDILERLHEKLDLDK